MRRSRGSAGTTRSRVIPIPPGISVLRYAAAEDPVSPPRVTVAPVDPAAKIELIGAPGSAPDTLSAPGMVLVIRSEKATELSIVVKPASGSRSAAAELKLERLISADVPLSQIPSRLQGERVPALGNIEILAHVAGRGDVLVSGGDWIAGPELPAQIEGIELRWPGKPADVDLEYVVTVGTRGAQRLPVRRTGEFAGTRGRGLPITSLAISLRGGNTLSMRLEALFLGAPAVSKKGRELSVAGPTGREPLVGLRMSMIGAQVQTTAAPKVIEPISRSHAKDQVRVFRGPRARAA